MKTIDLNADLGEGIAWEAELLPLISSANICCGAHAGSPKITQATVEACLIHNIRIGAHPGYPDPANFGRASFAQLGISRQNLRDSIRNQLELIPRSTYIKPHGAFYNETSTEIGESFPELLDLIESTGLPPQDPGGQGGVESIEKLQPVLYLQALLVSILKKTNLPLMGLANNTPHQAAAHAAQVPFIREGFIDRRYDESNRLLPRSNPDATIHDPEEAITQALRLAQTCDSLCVHGDNRNSPVLLKKVRHALENDGYTIKPK